MQSKQLTPDIAGAGLQPVPAAAAVTGGWARHERVRAFWHRFRLIIQEMNYATRRLGELQARLP